MGMYSIICDLIVEGAGEAQPSVEALVVCFNQ